MTVGDLVGGARYRLRDWHGGTNGLEFWRAVDTALDRDVAVTLVPPGHREVLRRTRDLGRLSVPGVARIQDVLGTIGDYPGVIVAEWTPGTALRDVVANEADPISTAEGLETLARAADTAHNDGLVLALDHPDRVRFDARGTAVLAFPGILPTSTARGDIRGIAAVQYALLTGSWPLRESGQRLVGGIPAAPPGELRSPRSIRPEVSAELSQLVMGALGGSPTSAVRLATPAKPKSHRGVLIFAAIVLVVALIGWWAVSAVTSGDDVKTAVNPSTLEETTQTTTVQTTEPVTTTESPTPAPVVTTEAPAPPVQDNDEGQLPCYPGYFHDPAHGGQCWAN